MAIVRVSSSPINPTFFRTGPGAYAAADVAVAVGGQNPFWPQPLDNVVVSAGDTTQPIFIWRTSTVDPALALTGETVFFARQVTAIFPAVIGGLGITVPINLVMIADNAFVSRITFQPLSLLGIPIGPPIVADNSNGNISQQFNQINPPFSWSNVFSFITDILLDATVGGFDLQFEAKVVNWNQPGGTPQTNPAGFTYAITIAGLLLAPATLTEVTPPVITFPLL